MFSIDCLKFKIKTIMENDLVSVLIPSYNHSKYVISAIKSIEQQTYKNIEIIVIDDGSVDDSVKIIEEYCFGKKIVFIAKKKNSGIADTLNVGLRVARGKYVSVSASDDIWHEQKIQKQVEFLINNQGAKIVFTEGLVIDSDGKVLGPIIYTARQIKKWYFQDVLLKADLPGMTPMVRMSDITQSGGYSNDFFIEDFPMWLSLLKNGGYAEVIKENLVLYRIHGLNTHTTLNVKVLTAHFNVVKFYSANLPNRQSILSEWRLRNANHLARTNKVLALRYIIPVLYRIDDIRLFKSIIKICFSF